MRFSFGVMARVVYNDTPNIGSCFRIAEMCMMLLSIGLDTRLQWVLRVGRSWLASERSMNIMNLQ